MPIRIQHLDPTNTKGVESLQSMILSFYTDYETDRIMTPDKIQSTITHLHQHPEAGCMLLIMDDDIIAGYAILINFWSNEFGGTILFTDELFIKDEYRNRGIGRQFFQLAEEKFKEAKILALELSPSNHKAARLYQKLGFVSNKNTTLFKMLG